MKQIEVYERITLIINLAKSGPFTWERFERKIQELSEIKDVDLQVSKRTFQRDIQDIKSFHGIDIQFNRKTKHYAINEEDSGPVNISIRESFDMIHAFQLSKGINDFVFFEERNAIGTEHLFGLVHAIQNQKMVSFEYRKFWLWEAEDRIIKPIALKEFDHRWYLLGLTQEDKFRTFGLDRITDLQIQNKSFTPKKQVDLKTYYQDVFGITNDFDNSVEKVILTFTEFKGRYIKSMPWHSSQKILKDDGITLTISLDVKINYELVSEILSHGDEVKVDGPERLKKIIKEKAKNITNEVLNP